METEFLLVIQRQALFEKNYLENHTAFEISECHFKQVDGIEATITVLSGGKTNVVISKGNGRLDAVSNALKALFGIEYALTGYEQHALSDSSDSKAISYVGVETHGGKTYFGAGVDDDIIKSSYKALTSAVNNLLKERN